MYLEKKWTVGLVGNKGRSYLGGTGLEQITREFGFVNLSKGAWFGPSGRYPDTKHSPNSCRELGWYYAQAQPRMPVLAAGVDPMTQGGSTTRGSSSERGGQEGRAQDARICKCEILWNYQQQNQQGVHRGCAGYWFPQQLLRAGGVFCRAGRGKS